MVVVVVVVVGDVVVVVEDVVMVVDVYVVVTTVLVGVVTEDVGLALSMIFLTLDTETIEMILTDLLNDIIINYYSKEQKRKIFHNRFAC